MDAIDRSFEAWPAEQPEARVINGVPYRMGTAGSFILNCPKCAAPDIGDRFREWPNDPLETCWTCRGPMEALTDHNLHRYQISWGMILGA